MKLKFTKMEGLGNDFVVIDAINQQVDLTEEQIRFMARRHFGIGCDQVLLVEPPRDEHTQFYYRIFNADGGEVPQCGNGARCFARFVREKKLTDKDVIDVGTAAGPIRLYMKDDQVIVNMGPPVLEPERIPFRATRTDTSYSLQVEKQLIPVSVVSMGNPHAVIMVDKISLAPVETIGPLIENHERFPERTNVGFLAVRNRGEIDLRVWERGVGETLACGTGACAAVVAGRLRGLLDEQVKVHLKGGDLVVSWKGGSEPVWMAGPANLVYEGEIEL